MNNDRLNEARAAEAAIKQAIAEDDAVLRAKLDRAAALQAEADELRKVQTTKGLREQLVSAQRDLAVAEEAVLDELNVNLAGEIMKRMAGDPVQHSAWIMSNLVRLRDSVRSALDVPVNKKFSQHPLITQALALLPPRDDLDSPVYELGYTLTGHTDWASRRKAIIARAEAENSPLEAA